MKTIDTTPCTLEDARKTIGMLLDELLAAQAIAIDRGTKLIAANELGRYTNEVSHGKERP